MHENLVSAITFPLFSAGGFSQRRRPGVMLVAALVCLPIACNCLGSEQLGKFHRVLIPNPSGAILCFNIDVKHCKAPSVHGNERKGTF